MPIETCIYDYKLLSILQRVGYSTGILENGSDGLVRKTIATGDIKTLSSFIESYKGFKGLIVVKPLSILALRYSIVSRRVNMIQFDNENLQLLKKSMINLIRYHHKFIEINLNKISSLNLNRIIANFKINRNVIFSSCAKEYYEIWPPLSKISFITLHGIHEELAIQWVYLNPIRLIISASRYN